MHASRANQSPGARWSLDIRYSDLRYPTGRASVPGFVGRSAEQPDVVAGSDLEWRRLLAGGGKYVPPSVADVHSEGGDGEARRSARL